jgi:hypothetical protein
MSVDGVPSAASSAYVAMLARAQQREEPAAAADGDSGAPKGVDAKPAPKSASAALAARAAMTAQGAQRARGLDAFTPTKEGAAPPDTASVRFPGYAARISDVAGYQSRADWHPQTQVDPSTLAPLGKPDGIVIHETQHDGNATVDPQGRSEIQALEYEHAIEPQKNGKPRFSDIGYHYAVMRDEKGEWGLYEGRSKIMDKDGNPTLARGTHAFDQNIGKIGITVQGDYRGLKDVHDDDPDKAKLQADGMAQESRDLPDGAKQVLDKAVGALMNEYPSIHQIYTHSDLVTREGKTLSAGHTDCSHGSKQEDLADALAKKFGVDHPHLSEEDEAVAGKLAAGTLTDPQQVARIQKRLSDLYVEQEGPAGMAAGRSAAYSL